jgi:hypothetical protein
MLAGHVSGPMGNPKFSIDRVALTGKLTRRHNFTKTLKTTGPDANIEVFIAKSKRDWVREKSKVFRIWDERQENYCRILLRLA